MEARGESCTKGLCIWKRKHDQQNAIDHFCFWWIWRLCNKHSCAQARRRASTRAVHLKTTVLLEDPHKKKYEKIVRTIEKTLLNHVKQLKLWSQWMKAGEGWMPTCANMCHYVPAWANIAVCQPCRDRQIQSLFHLIFVFKSTWLFQCLGKPSHKNRHLLQYIMFFWTTLINAGLPRKALKAGTDPAKDSMPRACRRGQGLPSDLPKDSLCLHLVVIDCKFVVRKVFGMTLPKTACPGHAVGS